MRKIPDSREIQLRENFQDRRPPLGEGLSIGPWCSPGPGAAAGSRLDCVSGEFRPLARPDRARWRRICDRRGAGSRRRRKGTRLAGPLAALAAASLAAAGGFPPPGKGGEVPSLALAEISRRWRLRGGAVWRQRGFAFLRPLRPPLLTAAGKYQRQGVLWDRLQSR